MFKPVQGVSRSLNNTTDTYRRVFDSRKRRVRGLWRRNERYFANVTVSDDTGRKQQKMVPLGAATLDQAKADYARLLTERADNRLRPLGMVPTVAEYLEQRFVPALEASGKRPNSIAKDRWQLERWRREIGAIRLNKLNPGHIDAVLVKLAAEGLNGRTVNLYLISLRNLIKAAARDRHVSRPLPYEGLEWRRWDRKSRTLLSPTELNRLVEAALEHCPMSGRQLADYLLFLAYSGCREKEALTIRWPDVDLERRILTVGAEGETKNRRPRFLALSRQLRAQLGEMAQRQAPDSSYLFPSPRRGEADLALTTFRNAFNKVRVKAGLPKAGFHDLRHFFASHAVMNGIDFVTVARWLGHRDNGALLARTYAHLAAGHEQAQAQRLNFGPVRVPGTDA